MRTYNANGTLNAAAAQAGDTSTRSSEGFWSEPEEVFPLGYPDPVQCFDNYNPAWVQYPPPTLPVATAAAATSGTSNARKAGAASSGTSIQGSAADGSKHWHRDPQAAGVAAASAPQPEGYVYSGGGDASFLFPSEMIHFALNDSRAPTPRAAGNDGVMDIRMLVSRDNVNFSFVSRDPFIPRGVGYRDPVSGCYNGTGSDRDGGFVFATNGGILDNGEANSIYMLYWGSQTTHAGGGAYLYTQWPGAYSGIFAARLRREGFVSLRTVQGGMAVGNGSFTTQPFAFPPLEQVCPTGTGTGGTSGSASGYQLSLNVHTSVSGSLSAALLAVQPDGSLSPVPGYGADNAVHVMGNYIRVPLAWTSDAQAARTMSSASLAAAAAGEHDGNAANGAIGTGTGTGGVYSDLSSFASPSAQYVLSVNMTRAQLYAWQLTCMY